MDDKNRSTEIEGLDDAEKEFFRGFLKEGDIEKILSDNSLPLSNDKKHHLGINPSEVKLQMTFEQLDEPKTYEEIEQQLESLKVKKGIIHGDLIIEELNTLIKLLDDKQIPFTIVKDPEYEGNIAFIGI